MEIIKKFKKSEKGSITVMVLTSMLFMLVVITASYLAISNESNEQNKKISQISKQYQVTDEDMEQKYQKILNGVKVKDYVKVGDYVDYDPTIATKDGVMVDESKLTYTSPTGTIPTDDTGIITHGNGYTSQEEGGGQTFTAKANDGSENGLKWRVLSVSDDKVELISETPVLKDETSQDDGNFVLQGGIGYLYAEQELNEVCKIYGYGYGADTSIGSTYTVGGPEDTPVIGKIEGTGARSITIEDLNKLAGIYEDKADGQMKYSDGIVINSKYGTETLKEAIYYPTLNSSDNTYTGRSANKKNGLKYTMYEWNRDKIDYNTQTMLFNGKYWLASRCVDTYYSDSYFRIHNVGNTKVYAEGLCNGNMFSLDQYTLSNFAVRPVVTLKSDVIDLSINYDKDNINIWRLK